MIEKIPPKGVSFSDFICTLAMDRISISMGVQLTHTGVGELLDNYLSQADQNMYRQKQERKKKDAEHKNN